jgi:hypothetical protein
MDLTRFTECCAAYGAVRRRWPAHEHALYDRLATTLEGAAILADAMRVDGLLDAWEVAAAPVPRAVSRVGTIARPARRRLAALMAALAACAGAGFAVGYAQAHGAVEFASPDLLLLGPHTLTEIEP